MRHSKVDVDQGKLVSRIYSKLLIKQVILRTLENSTI